MCCSHDMMYEYFSLQLCYWHSCGNSCHLLSFQLQKWTHTCHTKQWPTPPSSTSLRSLQLPWLPVENIYHSYNGQHKDLQSMYKNIQRIGEMRQKWWDIYRKVCYPRHVQSFTFNNTLPLQWLVTQNVVNHNGEPPSHSSHQLVWKCKAASLEYIIKTPARVNGASGVQKMISKPAKPKRRYNAPATSSCGSPAVMTRDWWIILTLVIIWLPAIFETIQALLKDTIYVSWGCYGISFLDTEIIQGRPYQYMCNLSSGLWNSTTGGIVQVRGQHHITGSAIINILGLNLPVMSIACWMA